MTSISVLRIGDILKRFMKRCLKKGWETTGEGEWVKVADTNHIFIWSRSIAPKTIEAIIKNRKLSVREGDLWRVKEADHIAFIISGFGEEIMKFLEHRSDLLNRAVLYDIDHFNRVGENRSIVFQEFEKFLKEEYGIGIKA